MKQASVVVLGGINMDLVTLTPRFPRPGETVVGSRFITYPGGKGANQAVAAARMGAAVSMVGRVGGDQFGPQLVDALSQSGVDVSDVQVDETVSSGIAVISIDASAQNQIIQVLGANDRCDQAQVGAATRQLSDASVLMLQLEVPLEVSLAAARAASKAGKNVIMDPGPVRPLPPEAYSTFTYLTPNETEAQALVGFPVVDEGTAARAAGILLDRGTGHVVIKLGSIGAYYASKEMCRFYPAHKVDAVDSVAAGDAFNGALAVALTEGRTPEGAMEWAMAAGALAVTVQGAQDSMPPRADVEAFLTARR